MTSLAIEWAPKVRVNTVVPGFVATESAAAHYGDADGVAAVAATVPLRRMATPDDVAEACLFLASPRAAYVSGASLTLHGGGEPPAFLSAHRQLLTAGTCARQIRPDRNVPGTIRAYCSLHDPVRPDGQAVMTPDSVARRFPLASSAAVLAAGLVLALVVVDVPLGRLAHQSLNASGGSSPVWFSAALGLVGFVVASRQPRNLLGWILLGTAAFSSLSQDASFYAVADYRLRHGGLPLGWVAVLAQPGWAPSIVLGGLAVLLFPDGQPPAPRWRLVLWLYLAAATLYLAGVLILSAGAIAGHSIRVDASGNLLVLSHPAGSSAWWGVVEAVFFPVLAVCWLGSVAGQVASYRRSSGLRRQQLKWLLTGSVIAGIGIPLATWLSGRPGLPGVAGSIIGAATLLALPFCMGVAIMRYRLFDIDRIISRTLAYAILTGLLVGVYAGIVLLATRVVSVNEPVAVAGSTLAVAALFNPLRRRVQRAVDRRFNRSRYDADRIVAAFAGRQQNAVDLDRIRDDLAGTVQQALEPASVSVWMSGRR